MKNDSLQLLHKYIRHMDSMAEHHQVGGILLTGDPGIGKTTFVDQMGALLGIKVVVIEVPHVTEEHLINIPFVVYNPTTNQTHTDSSAMTSDYKLVLAQSNLYAQLTSNQKMSDQQYLQYTNHQAPAHVKAVFTKMGGTEAKIPEEIEQARRQFSTILFLDEFYRQTSPRIRVLS